MELFTINNEYINFLRRFDANIYDNKDDSFHKRKYLGIVLEINGFNYFVPLSSKKNSDYLDGKIRKDTKTIIRLYNGDNLYGTVRISNMIPVLNDELEKYNIEEESDKKYKDLILNELRVIKKKEDKIKKYAEIVYKQKIGNIEINYIKNTVNFSLLEEKCLEYYNKKS